MNLQKVEPHDHYVMPIQYISVNKSQVIVRDHFGIKNITFPSTKDARNYAKSLQLMLEF
ncbi:hypothetical protein [Pseudoalteromonas xiamenensis]